jgi:hypothetical protein
VIQIRESDSESPRSFRGRRGVFAAVSLVLLLALAAMIAGSLFLAQQRSPAGSPEESASDPDTLQGTTQPAVLFAFDPNQALHELYGVASSTGRAQLAEGEVASVAATKRFDEGGQHFYVVIAQVEKIDQGTARVTRFGHGARLGAAVYRLADDHWQIVAKNPDLGDFGVPDQFGGGWEPEDTDLMRIGPEKRALILCATYSFPGTTGSRGGVYEINGGKIVARGFIDMSEANDHTCSKGLAGWLRGRKRCYSYEGTLEPMRESNRDYYDLVLHRKGTTYDFTKGEGADRASASSRFEVVAASDVWYRYNGEKYVALGPVD